VHKFGNFKQVYTMMHGQKNIKLGNFLSSMESDFPSFCKQEHLT